MASLQQARRNVRAAIGKGSSGVILGIVAVLLLALLFVKFSDEVVEQEYVSVDRDIALWIHGGASLTQTDIMRIVTELGHNFFILLVPLSLIIGSYIAWQARRSQQAGVAVAVLDAISPSVALGGASVLSFVIKDIVGRSRPDLFPPLSGESGPSFPSGHTLTAVAFYGMCAFLLARPLHGWARVGIVTLAVLIMGAVAYSRVYLGVHYPTDVLGSFILGAAWLITLATTLNIVEGHLKGAHIIAKHVAPEPDGTVSEATPTPVQ